MSSRSFRWLATIGAAALVAWVAGAANAREQADIYTRPSAGVGLGRGVRACYGRVARERLGAERGADDAVVGCQQRHEHLDALQRRRREGSADGRGRRGRRPAPCSTATLPTSSSARAARAARRGSCSRPRAARSWAGRRPSTAPPRSSAPTAPPPGRSTRASRSRTTSCTRPTSTTDGSTCSTQSFNRRPGRLQRPEDPEGLRAVRDPGARRQHLRDLRASRMRRRRTTSRRPARGTSTSSRPTASSSRRS